MIARAAADFPKVMELQRRPLVTEQGDWDPSLGDHKAVGLRGAVSFSTRISRAQSPCSAPCSACEVHHERLTRNRMKDRTISTDAEGCASLGISVPDAPARGAPCHAALSSSPLNSSPAPVWIERHLSGRSHDANTSIQGRRAEEQSYCQRWVLQDGLEPALHPERAYVPSYWPCCNEGT